MSLPSISPQQMQMPQQMPGMGAPQQQGGPQPGGLPQGNPGPAAKPGSPDPQLPQDMFTPKGPSFGEKKEKEDFAPKAKKPNFGGEEEEKMKEKPAEFARAKKAAFAGAAFNEDEKEKKE